MLKKMHEAVARLLIDTGADVSAATVVGNSKAGTVAIPPPLPPAAVPHSR